MTDNANVASRQTEPCAQRYLQASLYCDRHSSLWDAAAVLTAVFAPIGQKLIVEQWLKTLLQFALAAVVGFFLWRRTRWNEFGRELRNEFEYIAYALTKPYACSLYDESKIWQERFNNRQAKQPAHSRQDTTKWFFEKDVPPAHYLKQIQAAQLESLKFGRNTRLLWTAIIGVACVWIISAYTWIERSGLFRSATITLGTVAVIATVSQVGKIALNSFAHARARDKLREQVKAHNPLPDGSPLSAAIFQERINALRKSRVIVPNFVYRIAKRWE